MSIRIHYWISSLKATVGLLALLVATDATLIAQEITHGEHPAKSQTKILDIVRDPGDIPPAVGSRGPAVVHVTLTAEEVVGTLDPAAGTTYRYWTFNGKVPGPMLRVRQGDTVEVTLQNDATSHMAHSVDLHAALGPGEARHSLRQYPGSPKHLPCRPPRQACLSTTAALR